MTRTELEQQVYRTFGYADSPAAAVSTRIQGFLNLRHRQLLTLPGVETLRLETRTFATVASTATYIMEMDMAKILKVVDVTANVPLYERSLDWWRQIQPDTTLNTGSPQYYVFLRYASSGRATIATTGLWVVSTVAGDNTQIVHVETIDANGAMTSATATLNGTTRVQVGTATNHERILRFTINTAATGGVSLFDAATGGNRVSVIWPGRTSAQFQTLGLWPTPSVADTIQVDFLHNIRDFTVAYDEPQLPLDFHYLVSTGAKIDEARKKGDTNDPLIRQWQDEWDRGVRLLDYFLGTTQDTLIVPGRVRRDSLQGSNLGTFFPSGRW